MAPILHGLLMEVSMIHHLSHFISRFRKKRPNLMRPRTMAESQLEDLQGQNTNTPERQAFDEKTFERSQDVLQNGFGTSAHGGDNPFREEDVKNQT